MDFLTRSMDATAECDGFILPIWAADEKKDGKKKTGGAKASAAASKSKAKSVLPSWASALLSDDEFSGKSGQLSILRLPPSLQGTQGAPHARVVALVGLGEPSHARTPVIASACGSAFSAMRACNCARLSLLLPASSASDISDGELALRISAQLEMASYSFDKYKPKDDDAPPHEVKSMVLLARPTSLASISSALSRGQFIGQAVNLARSIQNEPANIATPDYVAQQAKKLANKCAIKCKVLGASEMKKQKMNAMLAVSGGSAHEPRLVLLEYRGAPSRKGWDIALVGKGVTFDSGGISIKPSSKMDEMKFDKSGACAVIGALSACSSLDIKQNIVGVAALVENMPSGSAYRPGDILTACNGTTMEILNTDAEGRVVLADALAYCSKNYKPVVMLDIATLTGACVVALGDLASGVLSEDEHLCERLLEAGEASGERLWRLPLWSEYDEKVKSEVAAVKNIGEPGSAGITAGASFLKPFVGECAWAHLDIAGTANTSKPKGGLCAGGTGVGVRLFLEFLENYGAAKKSVKKKN